MTTRFSRLFAALSTQNRAALIAFVHLCDPTPEASLSILETLSDAGADAFVLGLAFSDPCADSPEMAESAKRALLAGSTAQRALEIIAAYRAEYPDTPLILRTYANLLFARGIDTFFFECRRAEVDAVLVPDIPVPMHSPELDHDRAASENDIGFVLTAAPEDPAVTLKAAAERSHEAVLLTPSSGAAEAQTLSRAPAGVGQTQAGGHRGGGLFPRPGRRGPNPRTHRSRHAPAGAGSRPGRSRGDRRGKCVCAPRAREPCRQPLPL